MANSEEERYSLEDILLEFKQPEDQDIQKRTAVETPPEAERAPAPAAEQSKPAGEHLSEEEIQLLAHYGQLIDYRLHMKGRPYSKAVLTDVRYQLKYSQKSIKEIADYLEFPNISFFGKFVRRHVGCSPKEYRRRLQAEQ